MNTKTMNMEITTIANFRALIISKLYIIAMLGLTAFYYGIFQYNQSPLYIIIVMCILPLFIKQALISWKSDTNRFLKAMEDTPFLLDNLKAKYKFKRQTYVANSVTYLVAALLILLWQYKSMEVDYFQDFLIYVPVFILITGIIVRFLCFIIYRIKLPYDLKNNLV